MAKSLKERVEWVIKHSVSVHCDSSEDAERTNLMWDIHTDLYNNPHVVDRHYFVAWAPQGSVEELVAKNHEDFPDLYDKLVDHRLAHYRAERKRMAEEYYRLHG